MDSLFLFIRTVPPGCTNPSAPNYNAWAIHDDGSCVHGTRVVFEVNSNGQWASYQLEGPGFYYGDIVGPANEGDYPEDADGHIIEVYSLATSDLYRYLMATLLSSILLGHPRSLDRFHI